MFAPNGFEVKTGKAKRDVKGVQHPVDRLVKVERYLDGGRMLARTERGQLLIAHISPEAIARCRDSEKTYTPPFFGHLIDERMAKAIPPGHKVVLERCLFEGAEQFEGEKISKVVSTRVINVSEESEKIFEGIFTLSRKENKIVRIQSWEDKAFYVGTERENSFKLELDKVISDEAEGKKTNRLGFMLRFVSGGVLLDSVYPIDGQKKEDKFAPVSSDTYSVIVSQYSEYLASRFDLSSGAIEVMPFRTYVCSGFSKHFDAGDASVLAKIADKGIILSEGDSPVDGAGKVWAVGGVLQLTSDAVDKKTRSFVERNIATRLFYSAPRGDVRRFVSSPDGNKVEIPDTLKPKKRDIE